MIVQPKACLLIDGTNFYHAVKESGRNALSELEFTRIFQEVSKKTGLLEVRYYDAVKDRTKDAVGYAGQQKFHEKLRKTSGKLSIHSRPLRYAVNITLQKALDAGKQSGIIDECKNKLWQFLVNLKLIKLTKEKGIDVLMAVDAIEAAQTKKFDFIIFLTGDADFVPAVHLIKKIGVKTINLHAYRGSSTELRHACDSHALISFNENQPPINWY
ncbi:NYN domain-containing protein [Candidatus Micrarchaeota archaeon]|nr:NYN domain-containing protein [Candidatus Micrarchaeota archaeon]